MSKWKKDPAITGHYFCDLDWPATLHVYKHLHGWEGGFYPEGKFAAAGDLRATLREAKRDAEQLAREVMRMWLREVPKS